MKKLSANIRVSMVVWNEFTNDARVLKEAETLSAAGYDVVVCALRRDKKTSKRSLVSNTIKVERVYLPSGELIFNWLFFKPLRPLPLFISRAICLLYTSPSPRDRTRSRMPSSA